MQGERRIQVGRGPRAVEALLLAELDSLLAGGRGDSLCSSLPVRVVVPSRSLAQHLRAALVRHAGRPVLGCTIQTLYALALGMLARAGAPLGAAEALFPVLVRRLARREPALRGQLDELVDGYRIVEANVTDLLDAGFEAAHAEALDEGILAATPAGDLRERARAVARVAVRAWEAIEAGRVGHGSAVFRRARGLLEADPEGALPCRAVLVHGYADATGVQTDLIEALLRYRDARLFLDRPPDPTAPAREDPGVVFGRRFSERLTEVEAPQATARPSSAKLEIWHAPGPQAEAGAVAVRLRELLDAGAVAERIGVVARDLSVYRLPLRRHLRRLGIPFSGLGAQGPPGPLARRLGALLALLQQRERTPAERWIDAVELEGRSLEDRERADLRLALHTMGAARLGDVQELPTVEEGAEPDDVPLPVRQGLLAPEEGGGGRARRRRLVRELLDAAIGAARELCDRLAKLGPSEPLERHLERLRAIAEEGLGWRAEAPELDALRAAWEEGSAARDFELDHDDFLLLLQRGMARLGRAPLGGEGAGVQVLDVMEARARTFDHLFVLGLGRDVFPRAITEDPLLPDELRVRLRSVLCDLPIKGEGHDEERFLFAQLLAASANPTLSCAVTDDDGNARSVSPLLDRLRRVPRMDPPRRIPAPHGPAALERRVPRPAHDQALLAGLHGTRRQFGALLSVALAEAWSGTGGVADPRALAPARLGVLEELDATVEQRRGLGPYFGFVGPVRDPADPRRQPLYVTTAQRLAACPWQAFLGRLLRVEILPDALDALPSAEARLIGSLVHTVLERIVAEAIGRRGGRLEQMVGREPVSIPWPEPAALERLLHRSARSLLRAEGIALLGFERVLAAHARPRLEAARDLDWTGVLGAEVEGEIRVADAAGAARSLRFKVDRVDRRDGELWLLDYKAGRPVATRKREASRRAALLRGVVQGEGLQAAAYALAGRELGSPEAQGCYANLDPDLEAGERVVGCRADDEDFAETFAACVGALVATLDAGSLFPRLVEPSGDREPRRCGVCEVKEACLRGDSGARARLAAWTAAPPGTGLAEAERALLSVWNLTGEGS